MHAHQGWIFEDKWVDTTTREVRDLSKFPDALHAPQNLQLWAAIHTLNFSDRAPMASSTSLKTSVPKTYGPQLAKDSTLSN